MNEDFLIAQLKRHEGVKSKPYKDSVGKTTIGVGRNLDDVGVSQDEIDLMLRNDISRAMSAVRQYLQWFDSLDDARQDVLINMCFNMGIGALLEFKNTLTLIKAGQYPEAANEMLQSKWASQVGSRAVELANQMKTGETNA